MLVRRLIMIADGLHYEVDWRLAVAALRRAILARPIELVGSGSVDTRLSAP